MARKEGHEAGNHPSSDARDGANRPDLAGRSLDWAQVQAQGSHRDPPIRPADQSARPRHWCWREVDPALVHPIRRSMRHSRSNSSHRSTSPRPAAVATPVGAAYHENSYQTSLMADGEENKGRYWFFRGVTKRFLVSRAGKSGPSAWFTRVVAAIDKGPDLP